MDEQDTNLKILQELRNLNRFNHYSFGWIVGLLLIFFCASLVLIWVDTSPSNPLKQRTTYTWNDIRNLRERGQLSEALSNAKKIVQKAPMDWYGHEFIAYLHLEMGNLSDAEVEFATAFKLWPSKDNEKNLQTIRKRIESEKAAKQ
jgi:tetratricopeptide (TPR) repeat protein